ncbi:hypothetical protein BC835DRAFT_1391243 [Cytidiella melzeri]|nr:hypothetical protein BC835DRAFT_1391243 [Cytidiella melzeri]
MEPSVYARMVINSYTDTNGNCSIVSNPINDPWPIRPWFSDNDAGVKKVCEKFSLHRANVLEEDLVPSVVMAVTPERSRSQYQVMSKQSATDIARDLWPNILADQFRLSPKWNFEWIHRIGHALGGPQHSSNLLFGTSECNTDMMRTEYLIRSFVLLTPLDWKRRLNTTLKPTISQPRWCQGVLWNVDDVFTNYVPAKPERYSWAAPFLHYELSVKLTNSKKILEWDTYFDLMNRYVPLRLDVDIDEILMNQFIDWVNDKYGDKMAIESEPTK